MNRPRPSRQPRTDRQRGRSAHGTVLLAVLLGLFATAYAAAAPSGRAQDGGASGSTRAGVAGKDAVAAGKDLFSRSCSSCHGLNAQGGSQAPSLIGVGTAAVHFQVSTGRMPLTQFGAQAPRKQPKFTPEQIDQLAAYVDSLGGSGPAEPADAFVDRYKDADLARGGQFFRSNCSQCHNTVGEGGALAHGAYAPSLKAATPKQIYEAMQTGPEQMPVFSDGVLTPQDKLAIVKYVTNVSQQGHDEGGHPIGRVGPITEGLVAFIVGIGGLVAFTMWIGSRT